MIKESRWLWYFIDRYVWYYMVLYINGIMLLKHSWSFHPSVRLKRVSRMNWDRYPLIWRVFSLLNGLCRPVETTKNVEVSTSSGGQALLWQWRRGIGQKNSSVNVGGIFISLDEEISSVKGMDTDFVGRQGIVISSWYTGCWRSFVRLVSKIPLCQLKMSRHFIYVQVGRILPMTGAKLDDDGPELREIGAAGGIFPRQRFILTFMKKCHGDANRPEQRIRAWKTDELTFLTTRK